MTSDCIVSELTCHDTSQVRIECWLEHGYTVRALTETTCQTKNRTAILRIFVRGCVRLARHTPSRTPLMGFPSGIQMATLRRHSLGRRAPNASFKAFHEQVHPNTLKSKRRHPRTTLACACAQRSILKFARRDKCSSNHPHSPPTSPSLSPRPGLSRRKQNISTSKF